MTYSRFDDYYCFDFRRRFFEFLHAMPLPPLAAMPADC
jgi:hypothetical protein